MGLEENLNRIMSARRFGKMCGRDVSRLVLEKLGNPQKDLKIIHVAGTNGKGSVCAYIESVLRLLGYRTGLFTSPHLFRYNERIRVSGEEIDDESLFELTKKLLGTDFGCELTMFDYSLAMALLFFKERKCDFVILETGLGGRLDSTNAVENTILSVITKIGLDHTGILGNDLRAIAGEKAGILKKGVPAVIGIQEEEAESFFEEYVKKHGIEAYFLKDYPGEECTEKCTGIIPGIYCKAEGEGSYVNENRALAILSLELLEKIIRGRESSPDANEQKEAICNEIIKKGIESAVWRGRLEILGRIPFVLADAAHNIDGVQALHRHLVNEYPKERFIFVTAFLRDKDYRSMLSCMGDIAEGFVPAQIGDARALQGSELVRCLREMGLPLVINNAASGEEYSVGRAIGIASDVAKKNKKRVVIFGSIYFIAEVLKYDDGKTKD